VSDSKWRTHEAYIGAVADYLNANGFPVADWHADDNDPRDGNIALDMVRQGTIDGKPIWPHDEVHVGWTENRGWFLLTIDDRDGRDSRFVYDLPVARLASPYTVADEVAGKAGLTLALPDCGFPDLDFPEHVCEDDDNPVFEAALARYREAR
jgi:uncharacterized protein DUF6292